MTRPMSNVNWWITNPINNNGVTSDPRDNLGEFPAAKAMYRRVDGPSERNFRVEFTDGGADDVPAGSHKMHVIAADRFTPADTAKWPNAATFYEGLFVMRQSVVAGQEDMFVTRCQTYDNSTGLMTLVDPIPNGCGTNQRWIAFDPSGIDTLTPTGEFFRTPTLAEFETGVTQYTPLIWRTGQAANWSAPRAYLSLDDPGEAQIDIMFSNSNDPGGPDEVTGFLTPIANDTIVPTVPHFYGTSSAGRFSRPVSWELSDQPAVDLGAAGFPENRFLWIRRTLPPGFMPKENAYVRLFVETDPDDPDVGFGTNLLSGMVLTWNVPDYISGELTVEKDRSVYIGGGAKITASVKPGGVPVADVPVVWELENVSSPPVAGGSLVGTEDSFTDENGEAQVTYIAPTDKAAGDSPGPHVKVKALT